MGANELTLGIFFVLLAGIELAAHILRALPVAVGVDPAVHLAFVEVPIRCDGHFSAQRIDAWMRRLRHVVRTDDDAVVRHASVGIELRHVGAFDGAFGKAVVDGIERFKAFLRCPRLLINRFRRLIEDANSAKALAAPGNRSANLEVHQGIVFNVLEPMSDVHIGIAAP